ncbi:ice-binding family protein [Pontibacter sp. E15-1]|uniref:ice-binding family protein n=1 Tax=Pontibacter sp. E15-1 TaxID=2919918 RepID=UPI001F4FFB39|nr:ice-binding family protein [Pontibacter sp. E15-1]MCJ8166078.1 ice-binding family protein [Pontibacter sp. E15-1]
MIRHLLLIFLLTVGITTLSTAQTEQEIMGQATNFAVMASSKIVVKTVSGVTGSVGIEQASNIEGANLLSIQEGSIQTGTAATGALNDALGAYNRFDGKPGTVLPNTLKSGETGIRPGHYKVTGEASFESVLTLNAEGDQNGLYIFEIDGDLISMAPNAAIRLIFAQSKNIYWIVSGRVRLGGITNFVGTILAKGDIYLEDGVGVNGRAISLGGTVTLERNNLYLPGIVRTDVSITKTVPEKTYLVGDEITYTLAVRNNGPGAAFDVLVEDLLPTAGLLYVAGSAEMNKGTIDFGTANKVKWRIPMLEFAEEAQLKLTFRITAAGEIRNVAVASSRDPDPQIDDNESEVVVTVPPLNADLRITKVAATAPFRIGNEVTYTITVTNDGPYPAEEVKVKDLLPAGLELIEATAGYDATTGNITLGTMAAGAQQTITIRARITAAGTISNTAVVQSSNTFPDQNTANNTATAVIEVTCAQVPAFALSGSNALCEGVADAVYTATEALGLTYTFEVTGGIAVVSQNGNQVTVRAGTTGGTIKATATDVCGNTYTTTKAVGIVNKLANPTITGPAAVCANSTGTTYSVAAYGSGVTYTWATTGDLAITAGNNTPSVKVRAGASGGTLTLVANSSCFTTAVATVAVSTTPAPATPAAISGEQTVCLGSEATYSIDAVTGASGYAWTIPSGWSIVRGEGTTQITLKAGDKAVSGNVSVTASNTCGTSTASTLAVTVKDKLAAPAITGNAQGCIGAQLTYTIPAVTGASGYVWAVPGTWKLVSGQNTTSIVVEVGTGNGQVKVGVNNSCGTGTEATLNVSPTLAPTQTNQIVGEAALCLGNQSITYTLATITPGVTYNWTVTGGLTLVSGNGSGIITVKTTSGNGGTVSVVATNGCGTAPRISKEVSITTPLPAPTAIRDNSTVCDGLTYSIDAVQGATGYTWTVPEGFSITAGQGTTSIKVKIDRAGASGQVTVAALNGACGSPAASATIDASLADGELGFPKAFSPNGDGINDVWEITNLGKYTNNEVTIFNRWGSEVYKTKNYQNDWRGNNLEQGTYFYKVRVTVCSGVVKEFTGYVTIFR